MAADDAATPSPDVTRERLLAAALEMFLERGYEGTRVQDVAARAGFTTGAIYGNFGGKADLLAHAIAAGAGQAVDEVVDTLLVEMPAAEVLRLVAQHALAGPAEPVHRLLVDVFAASGRHKEVTKTFAGPLQRMRATFTMLASKLEDDPSVELGIGTRALAEYAELMFFGSVVRKALGLRPMATEDVDRLLSVLTGSAGRAPGASTGAER